MEQPQSSGTAGYTDAMPADRQTPQEANEREGEVLIGDICLHIEKSTELAVETEDYLSYATVIDLALGDPRRFNTEQASIVLATWYQALRAHPIVLHRVGWDFIELLLKYIDRFFIDDLSNKEAQKPFRLVMSLFSLLCELGNHKELLIRACELMLSTEHELNSKRMASMSLNDNEEEMQHKKLSESNPTNIDSATNGFDIWDDTKHENVKFCTLFEVIRFSLQNIETPVPSSFLLEAARTLLQVADDPNADLLSVSTYARRMFLLARDFSTKNEEIVSSEEMMRVRAILVNFLSHSADVVVRKYTLKWAERLYVQMRKKVATAPPIERDFVYTETEYTRRMSEVMSRFAQLMLSYDFDPAQNLPQIFGFEMEDHKVVKQHAPNFVLNKVEGAEVLADNYWSRQLLSGASIVGLNLLNTELHFDGSRGKKPEWTTTALFSLRIYKYNHRSQGCKDMLLYWALWVSNYFDTLMKDPIDHNLLKDWLQMLLELISTSPSPEEQFVTGSIVARALRFQDPNFAYTFCIDNMRESQSSAVQFVVVEALKMLITGKISNPDHSNTSTPTPPPMASKESSTSSTNAQLCTQNACIELSDDRKLEITAVSKDAILRMKREKHCLPWYYLNFLAVVPTHGPTLLGLCDELERMASQCSQMKNLTECCLFQINLLRKAITQLREQTLRKMQQ